MKPVLDWLTHNYDRAVRDLTALVEIQSISTDSAHAAELDQSAEQVRRQMERAGLQNVEILRYEQSYPYIYGEWLGAPGRPTVFLYAHHDVQPVTGFDDAWKSPPWTLTARDGRLYGRGSADDKCAVTAQLASISAFLETRGRLPVNIKMLVEGEEEVGSKNLFGFFKKYKDKIKSDVIVVNDTENLETGLPSITCSLRGIVSMTVQVKCLEQPVHSGMAGGLLPDAAIALNSILGRLYWNGKKLPIPGFYDDVRLLTDDEQAVQESLPIDESTLRSDMGLLPGVDLANFKGVSPYEQTWRWPAVTVIAQEASSFKNASNQVLPSARAIVSCRIVPDQDPAVVFQAIERYLTRDPPWGANVTVELNGAAVKWWITDPTEPAFEAARNAMEAGFQKKPIAIGCGGTIGFVGPLQELFDGAPALLLGIEDPRSNAHAPNESVDEGDFKKLMASLAHLYENLGALPDGKVR